MAIIIDPLQPVASSPTQGVQNTVPDPARKYAAMAIGAGGVLTLMLGVVCAVFPSLGGNPAPAFQYGAYMLALGSGIIWDRQVPSL